MPQHSTFAKLKPRISRNNRKFKLLFSGVAAASLSACNIDLFGRYKQVIGTDGDETLYGSNGNDNIVAGGGNDLIIGSNDNDNIDGGDGFDTITYANAFTASFTLEVKLDDGLFSRSGSYDWITNVENIIGSEYKNILVGNSVRNIISGLNGDDKIYGKDGDDWLFGGRGDDTIYGGNGDDLILGDEDDDIIYGDAGEDTLQGDAGDDQLFGGADNDILFGIENDDILNGGQGDDFLSGGDGIDVAVFSSTAARIEIKGNKLEITTANDGTDRLSEIELLSFNNGASNIDVKDIFSQIAAEDRDGINSEADFLSWLTDDAGYNYEMA